MNKTKEIFVRSVLNTTVIAGIVNNIYIDDVQSPWEEKIEKLNAKGDMINVRLALWNNSTFLYGRVYRLLLYVCDELDISFRYDPSRIPSQAEPRIRETYNHIWGIYIDSRVEKAGIENFFDRILRRNLFIDSQKNFPWSVSDLFFNKLWNKDRYTHAEIVDYARNIEKLSEGEDGFEIDAFEIEIGRSLTDRNADQYVDNIPSSILRDIARTIFRFVINHCRGTLVESSSYGIYFIYDQEIFLEMVLTRTDALLVTIFDFESSTNMTYTIKEFNDEIPIIEDEIKTIYEKIVNHSRLKIIKNPYMGAVEK